MEIVVRPCRSLDEFGAAVGAIGHYFGHPPTSPEGLERFAQVLDVERMQAAFDGDRIVGGAGTFTFEMSVPGGGTVPAAGVSVVGVLPTHRRRGILTQLMNAQLDDARAHGEALAYLWASEGTIYRRFGYGIASRAGAMKLSRDRVAFAEPFAPRGSFRLLSLEEAADVFPPLYEQAMQQRAGMFRRSDAWWRTRRLAEREDPKHRVLLELDGAPAGYALYTVKQEWEHGSSAGTMTVIEAVAPQPEAARELWRWLLDFDWTSTIAADLLPLDHELFLLLAEPRRMRFEVSDGVWVRIIDVGKALDARTFGDGEVTLEIAGEGTWRIGGESVESVSGKADIAMDISALGSVYLGGATFGELQRASRVVERVSGAIARADQVFGTARAPWCAEIF